jgi:plasmid stability protein
LTLDDEVAAKLRAEARKTDRSFRETVNEALRRGLVAPRAAAVGQRFAVKVRDLGELRAGLSLDNLGDLLERVESPLHR